MGPGGGDEVEEALPFSISLSFSFSFFLSSLIFGNNFICAIGYGNSKSSDFQISKSADGGNTFIRKKGTHDTFQLQVQQHSQICKNTSNDPMTLLGASQGSYKTVALQGNYHEQSTHSDPCKRFSSPQLAPKPPLVRRGSWCWILPH